MKEAVQGIAAYLQETGGPETKADEALASCVKEDGSIDPEKFQSTITSVLDTARKGFKAKLSVTDEEIGKKAAVAFNAKEQELRKNILTKMEDELAGELGIESGLRGDAFRAALKAKLTAHKQGKGDMTKEDVEKSKTYLDALEGWKNSTAAEVQKVQKAFDEFKAQVQTEKVHAEVLRRAAPIIEELKPKFDEDSETVRKNQWAIINRLILEGRQFDVQGDRVVPLDAEGHVLKDDSKNPVEFASLVKRIVMENIGVRAADKREGAGATTQHQKPGDSKLKAEWNDVVTKKDIKRFNEIRSDRTIPVAERQALEKAWEEKHGKAA